jgi:hypothetical protein
MNACTGKVTLVVYNSIARPEMITWHVLVPIWTSAARLDVSQQLLSFIFFDQGTESSQTAYLEAQPSALPIRSVHQVSALLSRHSISIETRLFIACSELSVFVPAPDPDSPVLIDCQGMLEARI